MFAPRVGVAYRWNDRTVLRMGFGVFRSFWWQVSSTTEGTGAETTTTMVNSRDGVTPADILSNPFPQGLVQPTSNSGLSTLVGSSISPFFYLKRFPYNSRWNFGVQRQLTRDVGGGNPRTSRQETASGFRHDLLVGYFFGSTHDINLALDRPLAAVYFFLERN